MKVGPRDLNSGAGDGVFLPQHEHEKSDCRGAPPSGPPLVHFWTNAIPVNGQCCMQKSGDFIQVPLQLFCFLTAVLIVVRVRKPLRPC